MNNYPTIQCGIKSESVTVIKIKCCSDPLMWYSGMVGKYVPFSRQLLAENCFISREPKTGYSNIVRLQDGELVEIVGDEIDYFNYY